MIHVPTRTGSLAAQLVSVSVLASILAGCAGAGSSSNLPSVAAQAGPRSETLRAISRAHPANCTPSVWASSPGSTPQSVIGYSGGSPCIAIDGSSSGLLFADPYGLATDSGGYLYVADAKNSRVVVFDNQGNYWSTLRTTGAPFGVCVSTTGVVGAANLYSSGNGSIDFFTNKGPLSSVSGPSNSISGSGHPNLTAYCAFDRRGDFFAGNPYGTPISYLRNYNVNVPSATLQTCSVPICTGSHSWSGMYSHIRPGTINTLSVADDTGLNVVNFRVNLGTPNHLNFLPWVPSPTTALTSYPSTQICQVAPTTGQNNASKLYIANCGSSAVDQVVNVTTGGTVNLFNPVSGSYGVATRPTGQY